MSSVTALPFTGERYVPEQSGNIALEHLHRYLLAKSLASEKRVLDIACGEGYGSALLAERASYVVGIDIDPQTIEHAKVKYRRDNLEFLVGDCTKIPLQDKSIDLIVSFETLEHHDKHDVMMKEFQRILSSDGILIISSPDKKHYSDERGFFNEFHVKELYEDEFKGLLNRYFKNVELYGQRIVFGSNILPAKGVGSVKSYIEEDGKIIETPGVYKPYYHIAAASDAPLESLDIGVLEQFINNSEIIKSWEAVMALRDGEIYELKNSVAQLNENIQEANEKAVVANTSMLCQQQKIERQRQEIERQRQEIEHQRDEIERQRQGLERQGQEIERLEGERNMMRSSNSWKVTKPLRILRRMCGQWRRESSSGGGRPFGTHYSARRLRNGIRYLLRGDFKGLIGRMKFYRREREQWRAYEDLKNEGISSWCIITTPHTLFIAHSIAERLATHGIASEIMTAPPQEFHHSFYVVLCAQMFEKLPPNDRRILFQLEQSVSSRWFTEKYLYELENSLAVFEYSLQNIEFLDGKGIRYPHVYYLPIGAAFKDGGVAQTDGKEIDFLFYGDSLSSPRRQKMLAELRKKFSVAIYNNLFGEEMRAAIRRAKIVVNIHYYDGALLETPRIQECMALGVPVLSEGAVDQDDYPELSGAVCFFEENSVDDMLEAATKMLANVDHYARQVKVSVDKSSHRFAFMLDRALVALGFLPEKVLLEQNPYIPQESNFITLSLPETIQRRRSLVTSKPRDVAIFDGARYRLGWVGCGISFGLLARYALEKGFVELTVFEDDALLPDDYDSRLLEIQDYLKNRTLPWDIFSGMMAEIHPDTRVTSVEFHGGKTYITVDRMVSMVFNIYNERALKLLSQWDPVDQDVDRNAIDRYLQNLNDLKVVVCLPFLVGHREELDSTLWGIKNEQYAPMITKAEIRLQELADNWIATHRAQSS